MLSQFSRKAKFGLVALVLSAAIVPTAYSQLQSEAEPPANPEMEQINQIVHAIGQYEKMTFNPQAAAIIAVSGIKDMNIPTEDKVKLLKVELENAESIGVRNAIRMTLNDIYEKAGKTEEAKKGMVELLRDNDQDLAETE